jgi:hypothetical protein
LAQNPQAAGPGVPTGYTYLGYELIQMKADQSQCSAPAVGEAYEAMIASTGQFSFNYSAGMCSVVSGTLINGIAVVLVANERIAPLTNGDTAAKNFASTGSIIVEKTFNYP